MKKQNVPETENYSTERIKMLTFSRIRHTPLITMNRRPLKNLGALAVAAAVIALSAVTVFAITYKRPAEVAKEMNAPVLAEMLEAAAISEAKAVETLSENTETTAVMRQAEMNESITSGKYTFTLLGILTSDEAAELQTIDTDDIGNTYAVVAIAYADGTPFDKETHYDPMTQDDKFQVTPLLTGIAPKDRGIFWNGGASEKIIDGVIYRITCTDDLEMFADKGVKLAVHTEVGVGNNAYYYDEEKGDYILNSEFDGSAVLFDLPLDKTKGDPEKAAQYFADQEAEQNAPLPPELQERMDKMAAIEDDAKKIDWTDAFVVEGASKTFTPNADGIVEFNVYDEKVGGAGGSFKVSDIFPEAEAGTVVNSIGFGGKMPDDVLFYATHYTLNADGTVTIEMVTPNIELNPHITKYPRYSGEAE
jgi:hypothetical protein